MGALEVEGLCGWISRLRCSGEDERDCLLFENYGESLYRLVKEPMSYLVESPQAEHAAIRKLQGLLWPLEKFFASLNLNPEYCWFLLEIQMERLIRSFKGDVDILIGRLHAKNPQDFEAALAKYRRVSPNAHPTWHDKLAALEIAESGGIEWPPRTDYLVGIETKCLKLDPNAKKKYQDTP